MYDADVGDENPQGQKDFRLNQGKLKAKRNESDKQSEFENPAQQEQLTELFWIGKSIECNEDRIDYQANKIQDTKPLRDELLAPSPIAGDMFRWAMTSQCESSSGRVHR